jgi:hypothetical protein
MKPLAIVAAIGLGTGVLVGALVLSAPRLSERRLSVAIVPGSGWTEVVWPFPTDQFGRGKAFHCGAKACGAPVTIYVRAKIGFCNCTEGVADDAELERIGDVALLDVKAVTQGDGRPVAVAHMKGRSRAYALSTGNPHGRSALSIGYNDRCDAVVATVVIPHERPAEVEAAALSLLNGPVVMRWTELTLGL